jgi:hypothetical protein
MKRFDKYGSYGMKKADIPLLQGTALTASQTDEPINLPYRALIGSLLYMAIKTRPDISHAVCVLARYSAKPSMKHWSAALRVLKYAYETRDYGICMRKDENQELVLVGYADSDHAGDLDDRKSLSTFCIYLNNMLFQYKVTKQKRVTRSTTAAELFAVSDCMMDCEFYRKLCVELGFAMDEPTLVHEDNKGAYDILNDPEMMTHRRHKNVDIEWHIVSEFVELGICKIVKIDSHDNRADIFTKALTRDEFQRQRRRLGVVAFSECKRKKEYDTIY